MFMAEIPQVKKLTLRDTDCKSILVTDWVAFDTETHLIGPGQAAPRMVCGSFCDESGQSELLLREDALDVIEHLLSTKTVIVGQNIVFDMAVCIANRPRLLVPVFRAFEQGLILSIDVIEKLRKIARGWNKFDHRFNAKPRYSLEEMVYQYLDEKMTGKKGADVWRLRYKELDGVPLADWPAEAYRYAMDDAILTARVFMMQQSVIPSDAQFKQTMVDVKRQMMDAFGLYMLRVHGFRTDGLAVGILDHELHDRVDGEIEYLISAGIYRYEGPKKDPKRKKVKNMAFIQQKVLAAFEARGEDCPMTEGGKGEVKNPKPKTDAETLENARDADLGRLADIMGDKKLLDTYVPRLKDGIRWPINPYYNVLVDSGRTSCSNPNVQNQPRKGGVRECFVPRPGHVYVGCDYHTAELRSLAHYCLEVLGVSEMAEALKHTEKYPHGKDLHLVMASHLLHIEYDDAVTRLAAGDKEVKQARQISKVLNFGFPGGLGAKKFLEFAWKSYRMLLADTEYEAVKEAKRLKQQWMTAFPEMRLFFDHISAMSAGSDSCTMHLIRSGRVRGDVGYTDGCNCVDYETEALTQRGWVNGKDLQMTDKLLTKHPVTEELEWQAPLAIMHYPEYRGPVVEFETRNLSACTTPNHRWLVGRDSDGAPHETTTATMCQRGFEPIRRNGAYTQDTSPWSDAFVRLAGWVLTDGSYKGPARVVIYQSTTANPLKVERIKGILTDAGVAYTEGRSRELAVLGFKGEMAQTFLQVFPDRKLTTDFVAQLSARQAALLLEEMCLGDGHKTKQRQDGAQTRYIGTPSLTAVDAIQMACVLAGKSSRVAVRNFAQYGTQTSLKHGISVTPQNLYYNVTILERNTAQVLPQHRTERMSEDGVWCPSVPNTFFVARRRGTTYVTGNTVFQSLTADGAKMAVWAVVKEAWTGYTWDEPIPDDATEISNKSPLLGYRPNGFIHDEIVGESPLHLYRQHAKRLAETMKEAMCWFVDKVPVEADAHVMRRWWKDAEPTYNDKGELIPWSPKNPHKVLKKLQADHPLVGQDWGDEEIAQLKELNGDTDWAGMYRAWMLDELAKERTGETHVQ